MEHQCHKCDDIVFNNSVKPPKLCLECGCKKFMSTWDEADGHRYEQTDLELDEWEEE